MPPQIFNTCFPMVAFKKVLFHETAVETEEQKKNSWQDEVQELGGGFKCFLFSPLLGEDSHFR